MKNISSDKKAVLHAKVVIPLKNLEEFQDFCLQNNILVNHTVTKYKEYKVTTHNDIMTELRLRGGRASTKQLHSALSARGFHLCYRTLTRRLNEMQANKYLSSVLDRRGGLRRIWSVKC